MANIAFGSNYFIFSKFSSFPKTSKIEQARAALVKEFNEFKEFEASQELADFIETGKHLESKAFKSLLETTDKGIASEDAKLKKYESQKKSKAFKSYFKFKDAQKLKDYYSFAKSADLANYEELKRVTSSPGFAQDKKKFSSELANIVKKEKELAALEKQKAVKKHLAGSSKKNDKTPPPPEVKKYERLHSELTSNEFKSHKANLEKQLHTIEEKEKTYKQLSKSRAIKNYFKFQHSQKFKNFKAFEKSKELADYLQLEKYLQSDECKKLNTQLKKDKEEATKKQKDYADFKSGKKYTWYEGLNGSIKFDELIKWKLIFEDDFSSNKLNNEKWMTRYFWGDKLIGDAYALEQDKAFPTDGKNVSTGKTLKIVTRHEKVTGLMWKQPFGFLPHEFDYTTGLVSTAKSHRQKYGKIEAKIKVDYAKPVNYHFWMTTDNNLPHIDILKLQQKKSHVDVGQVYVKGGQNPQRQSGDFKGVDLAQDFFIYTLEWSKDKLTWKINEVVVHEEKQNIPAEAMYLVLNASITDKSTDAGLPATMEVDWVKCYQAV